MTMTDTEAKAILDRADREHKLTKGGGLDMLALRARARRDAELSHAADITTRQFNATGDTASHWPESVSKAYWGAVGRANHHADQLARIETVKAEKRTRAGIARISEPRTYGPGSPYSFYVDHALAAIPNEPRSRDAVHRLNRHAVEVAYEARTISPEGRRARRVAETRSRDSDGTQKAAAEARWDIELAEHRALSSASTSGGAFVTPDYLVSDWSLWRSYPPSFWKASVPARDPGHGLTLYVPSFTSPANVAQQGADNDGATDSTPTGVYLSAPLVTMVGEVEVSQLLYDQSGPDGAAIDTVIHAQLVEAMNAAIDAYFLTQALAGAVKVTDSTTFSVVDLWADLGNVRGQMQTTAGSLLRPTHTFITPDCYEYFTSTVDAGASRPLLTPQPAGSSLSPPPALDGGPAIGFTGERLLSTPVFTDGNIANYTGTTNTQIVQASMPDIYTLVTEPTLRVIIEPFAASLSVVVQAYCYAGIVVRHSAAVGLVTGSAYPANPTFA